MRETRERAGNPVAPDWQSTAGNSKRSPDDERGTSEDPISDVPETVSYTDMKKNELMAACRTEGLSIKGTKQDLIDRLLGA